MFYFFWVWNGNCWVLRMRFGEGSSTPLQYSCLENPMDGGAWWAAVYGVAQSRTWLKRLSSSSSSHSVVSNSLQPQGLQHARLCCPSQSPRAYSNSCLSSQWCHPTIWSLSSHSPAFNLNQHQGLFRWVGWLHQVATVLELQLQLQHQSFQWIFRIDFL